MGKVVKSVSWDDKTAKDHISNRKEYVEKERNLITKISTNISYFKGAGRRYPKHNNKSNQKKKHQKYNRTLKNSSRNSRGRQWNHNPKRPRASEGDPHASLWRTLVGKWDPRAGVEASGRKRRGSGAWGVARLSAGLVEKKTIPHPLKNHIRWRKNLTRRG
jgi:hypothetical protein